MIWEKVTIIMAWDRRRTSLDWHPPIMIDVFKHREKEY
jgi:hypothetical protein